MQTATVSVCTTHARQQAQQGALFVDVRETADARALGIDAPEVFHLPLSELEQRWHELPTERALLVFGLDGQAGANAAQWLRDHGLTRAVPMRGGLLLWMQKGYPVIGQRFNLKE